MGLTDMHRYRVSCNMHWHVRSPPAPPSDVLALLLYRLNRRPPAQFATRSGCKWVTIGPRNPATGKRHGPAVCIDQSGVIRKGPPALTGKHISRLQGPVERETTRRQESIAAKQYEHAIRRRHARREGLAPGAVQAHFQELKAIDRQQADEQRHVINRDALATFPAGMGLWLNRGHRD